MSLKKLAYVIMNSSSMAVPASTERPRNDSIAIGHHAGNIKQGRNAVAIGEDAGEYYQSEQAIAIGDDAGKGSQGRMAVAIGYHAGKYSQGVGAIAVGANAGLTGQGAYAINVGTSSSSSTVAQPANSIVLNASGQQFYGGLTASAFYVNPVRGVSVVPLPPNYRNLSYNYTTKEVVHSDRRPGPVLWAVAETFFNSFDGEGNIKSYPASPEGTVFPMQFSTVMVDTDNAFDTKIDQEVLPSTYTVPCDGYYAINFSYSTVADNGETTSAGFIKLRPAGTAGSDDVTIFTSNRVTNVSEAVGGSMNGSLHYALREGDQLFGEFIAYDLSGTYPHSPTLNYYLYVTAGGIFQVTYVQPIPPTYSPSSP